MLGWGGLLAPLDAYSAPATNKFPSVVSDSYHCLVPPPLSFTLMCQQGLLFLCSFCKLRLLWVCMCSLPSHTCSSPSLRGSAVTTNPLLRTDVQKQLSARPVSELPLKSLPAGHALPASPLGQRPSSSGLIPIPKRTLVDTRAVFPTCRFYLPFLTLLDESPCPAVTPQSLVLHDSAHRPPRTQTSPRVSPPALQQHPHISAVLRCYQAGAHLHLPTLFLRPGLPTGPASKCQSPQE